jgi:hypothetical protein
MSRVVMLRLAFAVSCLVTSPLVAQVPAELRDLMRTVHDAVRVGIHERDPSPAHRSRSSPNSRPRRQSSGRSCGIPRR